jgi:hypothetical protein
MTGVRLLDSIDAKRPDGVYREGFKVRHTSQHKDGSGVHQIELIVSRIPCPMFGVSFIVSGVLSVLQFSFCEFGAPSNQTS